MGAICTPHLILPVWGLSISVLVGRHALNNMGLADPGDACIVKHLVAIDDFDKPRKDSIEKYFATTMQKIAH